MYAVSIQAMRSIASNMHEPTDLNQLNYFHVCLLYIEREATSAITVDGRCWPLAAGSAAIAGASEYVLQGQTGVCKRWKLLVFKQVKYSSGVFLLLCRTLNLAKLLAR